METKIKMHQGFGLSLSLSLFMLQLHWNNIFGVSQTEWKETEMGGKKSMGTPRAHR